MLPETVSYETGDLVSGLLQIVRKMAWTELLSYLKAWFRTLHTVLHCTEFCPILSSIPLCLSPHYVPTQDPRFSRNLCPILCGPCQADHHWLVTYLQ